MGDSPLVREIKNQLEAQLRRGFCTLDEAADAAIDLYADDDGYPGDAAVKHLAQELLQKILDEQQRWARPTDAERLAQAFDRLNAASILARHHYAPTRTWGRGDLQEEARNAAARGLPARGYVYYTSQDAEELDEGCLHLAFGAFAAPGSTYARLAQTTQAIAQEIHEQLTAAKLTIDWDGGLDETMVLYDLDWRCPRDSTTGRGILDNPSIAPPDEPAESRPSAPSRWPLTADDEWWVVVTFIAFDGSNAAEVALDVVWDGLQPDARESARRGPGAIDFVLSGLAEKPMRLDLLAAPAQPLHVSGRRSAVAAADVVVAIVRDEHADVDSVKELEAWTSESPRKPLVLLLEDAPVLAVLEQAAQHAARLIAG